MRRKAILIVTLSVILSLLLAGCVPGDDTYSSTRQAGFLWGIWHGWLAPISLVMGLFNKSIRIYEVLNTGWWYDFGFYMAIISGFGGLSLFRKKNSGGKK